MKFKLKKRQLLGLLPDFIMLTRGPRNGNALYLSLDDGPHPLHTPRVLDLLAEHGAHATFFLIGRKAEQHPGLVKRIVDEGHALGNHSYNHFLAFHRMPLRQQLLEIDQADRLLAQFDGRRQHLFRPPRGSFSLLLMAHFIRHRRPMAYWSYDSRDYQGGRSEEVAARLRRMPPRSGEVVLMHDDAACAGEVLGQLLPEWRASGRDMRALQVDVA